MDPDQLTDHPDLPRFCPDRRGQDDLDLLLDGSLAPHLSFDDTIVLDLPAEFAGRAVDLTDPEGLPLARLEPEPSARLTRLSAPEAGAFRRLRRSPAQVRGDVPDALTVPVSAPLTDADLADLAEVRAGRPVVLLALTGQGTPRGVSPLGLIRATLAAATTIEDAHVVTVPLALRDESTGPGPEDQALRDLVVGNYASGQIHRPRGEGALPEPVAAAVAQDRPVAERTGLVVFFTGLSGSGKSTLARALHDLILESGARTVTSLDGDLVRRNLSAGLGFSKEDRETNIRRIGWVAAEISRHRGVAICSPIAPFEATRRDVRRDVVEAGGTFFLVHVATPLAECERRDKKGLYAQARAGRIPEFTGISSPYEEPVDADVVVDTTGRSVEDALDDVLAGLRDSGLLPEIRCR